MDDRLRLLDEACAALLAGDPQSAQSALERFGLEIDGAAPGPDEQLDITNQLERLRQLAAAAKDGIESARCWLGDLQRTLGGLDVYDRGGRQRVSTELSGRPKRF